jgi:hypothetical protein
MEAAVCIASIRQSRSRLLPLAFLASWRLTTFSLHSLPVFCFYIISYDILASTIAMYQYNRLAIVAMASTRLNDVKNDRLSLLAVDNDCDMFHTQPSEITVSLFTH